MGNYRNDEEIKYKLSIITNRCLVNNHIMLKG